MQLFFHDEVKIFIKKLEKPTQSKVLRGINLIEEYGRNLGMPHTRMIIKNIFELRIRGQQEVRIIYTIQNDSVYLVHGFIKKTQKTPFHEIETALKRL
jgi:phage-related protein